MPGFLVECKNCHTQAVIPEGGDPHDPETGLQCADPAASGCCTESHHHGQAADPETGTGTPCRPITFYANAVTSLTSPPIQAAAGLAGQGN